MEIKTRIEAKMGAGGERTEELVSNFVYVIAINSSEADKGIDAHAHIVSMGSTNRETVRLLARAIVNIFEELTVHIPQCVMQNVLTTFLDAFFRALVNSKALEPFYQQYLRDQESLDITEIDPEDPEDPEA